MHTHMCCACVYVWECPRVEKGTKKKMMMMMKKKKRAIPPLLPAGVDAIPYADVFGPFLLRKVCAVCSLSIKAISEI